MRTLSQKQAVILEYIGREPERAFSPTEVGQRVGGRSDSACTWAYQGLRSLIKKGFVVLVQRGMYRITDAGKEQLRSVVDRKDENANNP